MLRDLNPLTLFVVPLQIAYKLYFSFYLASFSIGNLNHKRYTAHNVVLSEYKIL